MIALSLIVVAAVAQSQAQAPQIVADAEKITVRASDLELVVGTASGATTPISVLRIASDIAELQVSSASADDNFTALTTRIASAIAELQVSSASADDNFTALTTRITAVEVRNAILESRLDNSSLDDVEDDERDTLLANTVTTTASSLTQLQAQVAQLSATVALKATQNQLLVLEHTLTDALLANSTDSTIITDLIACMNQGGMLSDDTGACRVQSTTTQVFQCDTQTRESPTLSFTVPVGVDSIHAKLWGGGGSGSAWNTGGAGGYVEGDFAVTANEVIDVAVACPPANDQFCPGSCDNAWYQPGWPGMATGDIRGVNGAVFEGSPGGGYSGLFRSLPGNAIAVAAGGGGGGSGSSTRGGAAGGAGGGDVGEDGAIYAGPICIRGLGGNQNAGGAAGCVRSSASTSMTAGQALLSGLGDGGGGGGSGWFGGGGASTMPRNSNQNDRGGGGGGSSYTGGMENGYSAKGHRNIVPGAATRPSSGYIQDVARGGHGGIGGPGLVILRFQTSQDV